MARLVTLDVTNTCIRVAKSVGHHYVNETAQAACICYNCIHYRFLLGIPLYFFPQARVAQDFGVMLDESKVDKAFRYEFKQIIVR